MGSAWTAVHGDSPPDRSSTLNDTYPAVAQSVPLARGHVAQLAAAHCDAREIIDAVRLCASEALSNAVQHAYPDVPGEIQVTAWVVGRELWLLIADQGCGLQNARPSGGLGAGLGVIAQLSDDLVVLQPGGGGTELRMRFELDRPAVQRRGSLASATRPARSTFSTTT